MREEAGAEYCVHGPEDACLARLQCNTLAGTGRADDGGRYSGYYKVWEHLSGSLRLVQSAWAWTDRCINAPMRPPRSHCCATAGWIPGIVSRQVQNCRKGGLLLCPLP